MHYQSATAEEEAAATAALPDWQFTQSGVSMRIYAKLAENWETGRWNIYIF